MIIICDSQTDTKRTYAWDLKTTSFDWPRMQIFRVRIESFFILKRLNPAHSLSRTRPTLEIILQEENDFVRKVAERPGFSVAFGENHQGWKTQRVWSNFCNVFCTLRGSRIYIEIATPGGTGRSLCLLERSRRPLALVSFNMTSKI